ncbi:MAG TPA: hypothetical protein VGM03_23695 [Phycisphaerae bacterium]|jgi:hypothetical protein
MVLGTPAALIASLRALRHAPDRTFARIALALSVFDLIGLALLLIGVLAM